MKSKYKKVSILSIIFEWNHLIFWKNIPLIIYINLDLENSYDQLFSLNDISLNLESIASEKILMSREKNS